MYLTNVSKGNGNIMSKIKSSYKFKYVYLVFSLIFIGIIALSYLLPYIFPTLFIENNWNIVLDSTTGNQKIDFIPENSWTIIINIIRDICVSGLVGVILYAFYEHKFEDEEKKAIIDSVDAMLSDNIESHIVNAILTSKDINKHVLSSEIIDDILYNSLLKKVGDSKKTDAIMQSVLKEVINSTCTVRDLDVSMTINNFEDINNEYSKYESYKMTYIIRYKVILDADKFVFILTNSKEFQNNNLGAFTYCQFVDSAFSSNKHLFNINEITIDGYKLSLIGNRIAANNYIKEEYWNNLCDQKKGKEVQICYSVEFLVRKKGNHYSYFTPFISEGIHLKFDSKNTDIERIKLLTYFNSVEKPTIITSHGTTDNPREVEITLNDWVLPSSGTSFIWQFEKK